MRYPEYPPEHVLICWETGDTISKATYSLLATDSEPVTVKGRRKEPLSRVSEIEPETVCVHQSEGCLTFGVRDSHDGVPLA